MDVLIEKPGFDPARLTAHVPTPPTAGRSRPGGVFGHRRLHHDSSAGARTGSTSQVLFLYIFHLSSVHRCLYETFFDGSSSCSSLEQDQVDYAINHPILHRLSLKKPSVDVKMEVSRIEDDCSVMRSRNDRSSLSSLEASVSSLEDDDLNRTRVLRPLLHLSPMQRTRISESVLSPISDKSENDEPVLVVHSQMPVRKLRPQQLFPCAVAAKNRLALNNSDSGISISANSLETSHEALSVVPTQRPSLSSNSHEALSEPNDLPFLMPKLKRSPGILQTLGTAFQSSDGRPLSLTLPFPASGSNAPPAVLANNRDLADDAVPLEKQSWYHGSITRQDAEKRLKPTLPGTFLVRDSLASQHDYFLAARSENGFLHVRIDCHWLGEHEYALCTLPDRRFKSVPALVNHCANVGIYSRRFPPLVLKYPLAEEAF